MFLHKKEEDEEVCDKFQNYKRIIEIQESVCQCDIESLA